jgi:hypothetical protein
VAGPLPRARAHPVKLGINTERLPTTSSPYFAAENEAVNQILKALVLESKIASASKGSSTDRRTAGGTAI